MAERGVYGTLFGYGVGIGWDGDNGPTLSGFKSSSVGVAGDVWVAVSWGGGWKGVSVYIGGGVRTGVPSPITGSVQKNIGAGAYHINLGTDVTDRAEVGVYYEGDPVVEVDWRATENTLNQLYDRAVLEVALRELATAKSIPQHAQDFLNKYGDLVTYKNFIPETSEISGSPTGAPANNHCFLHDSSVRMWPLDLSIEPRLDGGYDEELVLSKVWYKQADRGDRSRRFGGVLRQTGAAATGSCHAHHAKQRHAYSGLLGHGRHPRPCILLRRWRIQRPARPASWTFCAPMARCSAPRPTRCRFHWRYDDPRLGHDAEARWLMDRTQARQSSFGTRIILPDGRHMSFMEMAASEGWRVSDDGDTVGQMKGEDGTVQEGKFPFPYTHGAELPKPEDYILTRSAVTLEDIYLANEWERIGTRMPVPDSMAGFNPNGTMARRPSKPRPNIPPAFANRPDAPIAQAQTQRPAHPSAKPSMNRKRRKAMEAKMRKAAEMRKRTAV